MGRRAEFGMATEDGDAAVGLLLSRILLSLGPDSTTDEVSEQYDEGLALIGSLHPEVWSPYVRLRISAEFGLALKQWLRSASPARAE